MIESEIGTIHDKAYGRNCYEIAKMTTTCKKSFHNIPGIDFGKPCVLDNNNMCTVAKAYRTEDESGLYGSKGAVWYVAQKNGNCKDLNVALTRTLTEENCVIGAQAVFGAEHSNYHWVGKYYSSDEMRGCFMQDNGAVRFNRRYASPMAYVEGEVSGDSPGHKGLWLVCRMTYQGTPDEVKYLAAPLVNNLNRDCWNKCGGVDGAKCSFCGTEGKCCQKGWGGCGGARNLGCYGYHCCAHKPPMKSETESESEIATVESTNTGQYFTYIALILAFGVVGYVYGYKYSTKKHSELLMDEKENNVQLTQYETI